MSPTIDCLCSSDHYLKRAYESCQCNCRERFLSTRPIFTGLEDLQGNEQDYDLALGPAWQYLMNNETEVRKL